MLFQRDMLQLFRSFGVSVRILHCLYTFDLEEVKGIHRLSLDGSATDLPSYHEKTCNTIMLLEPEY